MMLILRCFSHKTTCFATFTSEVCSLIRYKEKREKIKKIKENSSHIDLLYKIIETDLIKLRLFKFSQNKNISSKTSRVFRILNWFCFLWHTLRHKNINYEKFSYSNLQLPGYIAYRSLQKITNLIVRHLTRPYFLESSGGQGSVTI